ncbi:MAG: hypothetical protein ACYC35_27980 [Pirellulales bacterium]
MVFTKKQTPVEHLADDAEWSLARAKLTELERQLAAASSAASAQPQSAAARIAAAAARLLSGEAAGPTGPSPEELRAQDEQRQILAKACEMQREVLAQARDSASERIRATVFPRYKQILAEMATTLTTLNTLQRAEQSFREDLEAEGVRLGQPLPTYGGFQTEEKTAYAIERWFTDMRAAGLIS